MLPLSSRRSARQRQRPSPAQRAHPPAAHWSRQRPAGRRVWWPLPARRCPAGTARL